MMIYKPSQSGTLFALHIFQYITETLIEYTVFAMKIQRNREHSSREYL